jgi:hypothetical protein
VLFFALPASANERDDGFFVVACFVVACFVVACFVVACFVVAFFVGACLVVDPGVGGDPADAGDALDDDGAVVAVAFFARDGRVTTREGRP